MKFLQILVILFVLITLIHCISTNNVQPDQNTEAVQNTEPVKNAEPVQEAGAYLVDYYKLDGNLKDEKGLSDGEFAEGNIKEN